jgi:hypothetical protein
MTRDHIPPIGFFPPPAPTDLIVLPCCKRCNKSYDLDDEAVRLWVTSSVFTSTQGEWIFQNKVLGSTLQRSPKLRENLKRFMGTKVLKTSQGDIDVPTIGIPVARLERFVKRVCKGLLYHLYPRYSYTDADYLVMNMLPTAANNEMLLELTKDLVCDSRGGTVFRFWHGFANDNPDKGLFVLMFYDGACFFVFVGRTESGRADSVVSSSEGEAFFRRYC